MLQLREPSLPARDIVELAGRLRRRCLFEGVRILLNDRFDIARGAGVDGVHLRSGSVPVKRVRELVGPDFVIGCSAHELADVRRAEDGGADFVVVGPVFPTPSKRGHPGLGLEHLRRIRRQSSIPILALGGIRIANAAAVLDCGIQGLAGIRFFHDRQELAAIQALVAQRQSSAGAACQAGQDSCP
ncbi:MAG: thiamine phosphate synthase [Acidobacteria bacterium]|nr:thiamine phosphate synthase [Acidobacteriota bacterium]